MSQKSREAGLNIGTKHPDVKFHARVYQILVQTNVIHLVIQPYIKEGYCHIYSQVCKT